MWPFKKKKKHIHYKPTTFEVGRALLLLTFDDGTNFYINIHGRVEQYSYYDVARVVPIETVINQYLGGINGSQIMTYQNDDVKCTKVMCGRVRLAEVANITKHSVEFTVAHVEE